MIISLFEVLFCLFITITPAFADWWSDFIRYEITANSYHPYPKDQTPLPESMMNCSTSGGRRPRLVEPSCYLAMAPLMVARGYLVQWARKTVDWGQLKNLISEVWLLNRLVV